MNVNFKKLDILKEKLNNLRSLNSDKVAHAFDIEYTYESNKIEGNTLSLNETALVIEKGLTISNKPLKEHLEAINHKYAIDFIKEIASKNESINESVIQDIHRLVLQGIDRKNAGSYRTVQVLISGSKHIPPQPILIKQKMEEMICWYKTNINIIHPVELAAEMHERLVTIHPFIDGNGRTSRLLMNLILLQSGYPIVILKGDTQNRLNYYNALENAQMTGDKTQFIDLIRTNTQYSLEKILRILGE